MRLALGLVSLVVIVYVQVSLSGCSRTELITIDPESIPDGPPVITEVIPHLIIPGLPFTVFGANFDATPVNNTLIIGITEVAITAVTATSLEVTLPENFPSGEYPVSIKVGDLSADLDGTVKVAWAYIAVEWMGC